MPPAIPALDTKYGIAITPLPIPFPATIAAAENVEFLPVRVFTAILKASLSNPYIISLDLDPDIHVDLLLHRTICQPLEMSCFKLSDRDRQI